MNQIFRQAKAMIQSYEVIRQTSKLIKLPVVKQLEELINSNSLIRMNLEMAIENSPQTLRGKSVKDIVELINTGVQQPPGFTLFPLVASPVGILFCQLAQNQNGRNLISRNQFNLCLKDIFMVYNAMLKSQESLKYMNQQPPFGWFCDQAKKYINYSQFECDPRQKHYGFSSWNDFFTRKFKPEARPIAGLNSQNSEKIIISSCEAFPLDNPLMPVSNIKRIDRFWLKDQYYSLKDIFGVSFPQSQVYSKVFEGGTIYQGFLDAFYYHRWHSPVDGIVEENYLIQGHYFADRSQFLPKELDSLKAAQSFLASVATRRIIVLNADNKDIGRVALVYIGMADISSCISDIKKGEKVKKGQYLGHFQIGGSSHAIIFEKKAELKFTKQLYDIQKRPVLQKVNSLLAELI